MIGKMFLIVSDTQISSTYKLSCRIQNVCIRVHAAEDNDEDDDAGKGNDDDDYGRNDYDIPNEDENIDRGWWVWWQGGCEETWKVFLKGLCSMRYLKLSFYMNQ